MVESVTVYPVQLKVSHTDNFLTYIIYTDVVNMKECHRAACFAATCHGRSSLKQTR